jgi:hypothetical protein
MGIGIGCRPSDWRAGGWTTGHMQGIFRALQRVGSDEKHMSNGVFRWWTHVRPMDGPEYTRLWMAGKRLNLDYDATADFDSTTSQRTGHLISFFRLPNLSTPYDNKQVSLSPPNIGRQTSGESPSEVSVF